MRERGTCQLNRLVEAEDEGENQVEVEVGFEVEGAVVLEWQALADGSAELLPTTFRTANCDQGW